MLSIRRPRPILALEANPNVSNSRRNPLRGRGFFALTGIIAFAAVAFLVMPLVHLFLCHPLMTLARALDSSIMRDALTISLMTSLVSTLIVVVVGTLLAYVLARFNFPGKSVVDTLIDLPMVLPPMVTGLALLMLLGRTGPIGSQLAVLGIHLTFTPMAVVIACVFVSLPFFVRAARAGFESVDSRLETASLLLGATQIKTFFKVTIPLTWHSLLAGAVLAWARCLGEFGATIIFAGNFQGATQTMPLAIFNALQDDSTVPIALSIILLAVSFVLVMVLKFMLRNKGASYA